MNYTQLLKQHQLKATPQRIAIVSIMDSFGHISIEDLFTTIRHHFSSISLATLYKNVHTMMDSKLVREVKIPGQKTKYEIEKASHAHIMCKSCGELKDMDYDLNTILEKTVQISQYKAEDISIVVSGICPECQKK